MKQNILIFLGLLSIAVVLLFGIIRLVELRQKELDNQARYQCAQSSRYMVSQTTNVTVWYPVEDLYQKCLKEKGI